MAKSDLRNKSDEELMESYKTGETIAFEVLYERHSGRVQGYLQKKLFSPKEAQDLLQEVFFKLHRSRHQYNGTLPFSPWLFSITRSIWLDHLKKKSLEDATEQGKLEALQPVVQVSRVSDAGIGQEILDRLPESQKEAVGLRVFDEATFEEIATRLSTSPENARQLVSRGLKRLREIWGSRKDS
jgi:RNA polymerase sigma-70 factor (ECF subfamily)